MLCFMDIPRHQSRGSKRSCCPSVCLSVCLSVPLAQRTVRFRAVERIYRSAQSYGQQKWPKCPRASKNYIVYRGLTWKLWAREPWFLTNANRLRGRRCRLNTAEDRNGHRRGHTVSLSLERYELDGTCDTLQGCRLPSPWSRGRLLLVILRQLTGSYPRRRKYTSRRVWPRSLRSSRCRYELQRRT